MPEVILDHQRQLTLDETRRVAVERARVRLAPETRALLARRREEVVRHVNAQQEPAYGFNRGFGHNVKLRVAGDEALLDRLQLNLIRSHSVGIGEPAPRDVVRAAMLLRAASLSRGHSGVRPEVVETLLALLAADIVPVVPRLGSVSASGDLCAMSHIALALLGEGEVLHADARRPAAAALADAGIAPLVLQMKEGLALNNGCQYTTAIGLVCADRLMDLLRTAVIATALSSQLLLGSAAPYGEALHALRPHPGGVTVARWLRELLADSPIQAFHCDTHLDGEVQDPYNLRCAPQVLGACHDLIVEAQQTFLVEANSVTDNPVILELPDGSCADIVSGGHFHGMPVAVKLYNLVQAAAIMARLSNMRCARFVDEARNKGLGSDLVWPELSDQQRASSSALMAAELTSASLANWIWGIAMPSHLLSISTDAGQEDHVSMAAPLGVRLLESLPRLAEVLAVELAFCCQAAAIRRVQPYFPSRAEIPAGVEHVREAFEEALRAAVASEEGREVAVDIAVQKLYPWTEDQRRLSPPCEAVIARLAEAFPPVLDDRPLSDEITAIARLVDEGVVVRAVGQVTALR